jgi:hypothetical protein
LGIVASATSAQTHPSTWLASGSHADRPLYRIDVIEADDTFAAPLFFIALQLPDSDNLDFVTPV